MIARSLPFLPPFRRRPALAAVAVGGTAQVEAKSWLRTPVYFHWWLDGMYLGRTRDGGRTLRPDAGEQFLLELFDTRDDSYDPDAFLVHAAPGKRLISWLRSFDPLAASYRIEQQQGSAGDYPVGGGDWLPLVRIPASGDGWSYSWLTPRLADQTEYAWRVVPLDASDRPGTPLVISAEMIVRGADAPAWDFSFDDASHRITISNP